ncbi:hypothetical protein CJU94_37710 (plasmid) [Paraburkholderia aromaticivorans]|uniref:Carboxymuconolactone decarboxylase-like domain-containing protein n=1 Tax=Paraburkholderia aromaticivorans TaxID=2026199 RepID=A0A248VY33_9BURK|nr:hypothetical protein CJU94_37710 [Paraburkholderia aromaticivorans]
MQLTDIDPALGLMAEFGKLTKNTAHHINQMRQEAIFSDGALPAPLKALAAMLWAISARCEPCFKFYVQQAVKLGATEQELGEVLAVASTMGGCVGEMNFSDRLRRGIAGQVLLPASSGYKDSGHRDRSRGDRVARHVSHSAR